MPSEFFSNSQGRIYTSLMRFSRTHSVCTSATKDVYILPLTVSRETKIFSCQLPRTYIRPSCTSPAVNDVYIRPHKVTYFRCLVVGCIFLWLLSYIYKVLDIIEIISNCNTNSQGRIYWDSCATNKRVCML